MADENNNNGDQGGGSTAEDRLGELIGWILGALLFAHVVSRLPIVLRERFGDLEANLEAFLSSPTYGFIYTLSALFSILCLTATIYTGIQKSRLAAAEKKELERLTQKALAGAESEEENQRWQEILSYASSDDPRLWRLSIIEADVMLNEMMEAMGYLEEGLGEKLRAVEKSDFNTIEEAWNAHKMRNRIAHEGSNSDLSREEVEETINNYRKVFEEFSYI